MLIIQFAKAIAPRAVSTTAAIAALLVMSAVSQPQQAWGGCGDYVAFGGHQQRFADVARLRDPVAYPLNSKSMPAPIRPRCNSIECSQSDLPPLAPVTIRVIPRQDACQVVPADAPQTQTYRDYGAVVLLLTVRAPDRIFRPPRIETTGRG